MVRLTGVSHSFGDIKALLNVDFEAQEGEIHALVGENGAGKTTLAKILYGAIQPDAGQIELDGVVRKWRGTSDAIEQGVGMVSQHYSVIPELTCLQNLVLGAEGAYWLSLTALRSKADELASSLSFSFDWNTPASSLSPVGMQKLEILKLLWRKARVLILDEPTATLSPQDSEAVFSTLRGLADQGACVIVVTHKVSEVMRHCDSATVLRGGRKVADLRVGDTSAEEVTRLIIGHEMDRADQTVARQSAVMLEVASPRTSNLPDSTLRIYSGEVVGIAGVDGNGQRELFLELLGLLPTSGKTNIDGSEVGGLSTRQRLRKGLRVIPEDRLQEGAIDTWSLEANAILGLHDILPLKRSDEFFTAAAARLGTKYSSPDQPFSSLSGGNQQRLVAGRALAFFPKVILAFHPSRGLDIDATVKLYEAMRDECKAGACALVVSFDLDELLDHCDRVFVMRDGLLHQPKSNLREEIGALMVRST